MGCMETPDSGFEPYLGSHNEPFSSCGEFVVLKDVDGFGESAGALRAGA
jgi:hypothetical protein